MPDKKSDSLDILGIKPVSDSLHTVVKATVDGASAFLSRICLPAAEEFGLLLRDRVSHWRGNNAAMIATKAEQVLRSNPEAENHHAHPRLVAQVIEHGSWASADDIQDLWAGLLASSCTPDGSDDSNLIFIDLLSRLTLAEAKILSKACSECDKVATEAGWISSGYFAMSLEELKQCTGIEDFHRIDRELDHLRTLGLIYHGFEPFSTEADLTPTGLALQMYARCHGWSGNPLEFFGVASPEP